MTIRRMMNTLLENLEIAQKNSYVKKPFSWALYQTWKTVNAFEKERKSTMKINDIDGTIAKIVNCGLGNVLTEGNVIELLEEVNSLRKAYAMACEEIGIRTCEYYLCTDNCKSFCEQYDACVGNIEYEDYFLKKARTENDKN